MGIERLKEFWPEWKTGDVLGKGSFGRVYKAENNDGGFTEYSAIKVISIPSDEAEYDALRSEGMSVSDTKEYFNDIVKDFVNEIKLMVTLKGAPNIVAVEGYKILEQNDGIGWDIFIRMELLTSFKDYLDTHTPTESEIVKMGIDIANALEICQQRHIIHRDIKPANIFLDGFGSFKLGDFGIAKELEKTTGAASSKGTFSYMAPEVAHGQRYDSTVDIYSLGLVMYTLLNNNRPPFVSSGDRVTYNDRKEANDRRLAGDPLPAPCNASPGLADIILTACSYDPARRFKSASAFKNALKSYNNAPKPTPALTPSVPEQNIDETVAVARKPEAKPEVKPEIDTTVAVAHKPEVKREENIEPVKTPKKKKGGIIAVAIILVVALLAVAIVPGMLDNGDESETEHSADTTTEIAADENNIPDFPEISASAEVGDTVTFGAYEQDNDTSNGKEEIEWIVLAKEYGKALVVSKYAIDYQPYNEDYESITWEECTLREWLNDDFYNAAFSEAEKGKIETTYVVNDDNPNYGTEGGNNTSDEVFLLSIDEAEEYFSSDEAMCCEATSYAEANGAYVNSSNGNCWWWLRSPGNVTYYAASVSTNGGVDRIGYYVNYCNDAVRPALWINLES